jgi:hypothetical protein
VANVTTDDLAEAIGALAELVSDESWAEATELSAGIKEVLDTGPPDSGGEFPVEVYRGVNPITLKCRGSS